MGAIAWWFCCIIDTCTVASNLGNRVSSSSEYVARIWDHYCWIYAKTSQFFQSSGADYHHVPNQLAQICLDVKLYFTVASHWKFIVNVYSLFTSHLIRFEARAKVRVLDLFPAYLSDELKKTSYKCFCRVRK